MRVVSYNILDGGEGRADPLAEVILAQRPDVVALVEAEDLAVLERLAMRLDMDCVQGAGRPRAAAILSRWPIVESVNHAPIHEQGPRSLLEAVVRDPQGTEWIIAATHFRPHMKEADEDRRLVEAEALLEVFQAYRQQRRPHVLAGDFNANAPQQTIDIERCRPSVREEWQQNGGRLPRRVVQRLLDEGYVDTLHAVRGEEAMVTPTFTTNHPGQRVDYIFTWGIEPSRLRGAWVERDRLATYASDHYPVGVEIA
jgi:exodeoxyribonuclease III